MIFALLFGICVLGLIWYFSRKKPPAVIPGQAPSITETEVDPAPDGKPDPQPVPAQAPEQQRGFQETSSTAQSSVAYDAESEEIAFIDLETTGLDCERDRIIEVAVFILKPSASGAVEGYSQLANPGRPIPKRITELTGITNEMVSKSRSTGEVVSEFLDRIGRRGIAAYNAEFDIGFLKAEASRLNRDFDNEWVCIMQYTKAKHPDLTRYRLGDACDAFGIFDSVTAKDGIGPHRALYDAERMLRLYMAISKGQQPNPPPPRASDRQMNFAELDRYHTIRGAAKRLAAKAKEIEKSDLSQAIFGYQSAIELLFDAGKMEIYATAAPWSSSALTSESGDIDCLNRLTLCLCKLKRGADASAAMTAYFAAFPREAELKTADQIRKRVAKAMSST